MKNTLLGYVDGLVYILTILAVLPYSLGEAAAVLSPEWKLRITITGLISGAVVKIIKGHLTPDAPSKGKEFIEIASEPKKE